MHCIKLLVADVKIHQKHMFLYTALEYDNQYGVHSGFTLHISISQQKIHQTAILYKIFFKKGKQNPSHAKDRFNRPLSFL